MKKVVLLLFSFVNLEQMIDHTFELLENEDELYVIEVIDKELPPDLSTWIHDVGFLGEQVVKDVEDTVVNECRKRAQRILKLITKEGEKNAKQVKIKLLSKTEVSKLKRELNKLRPDYLLINQSQDQPLVDENLNYSLEEILSEIEAPKETYYDGQLKK